MKKGTRQKFFKRCLTALLSAMLIVSTMPVAFAAEAEVVGIQVDDVTITQYTHGYITTGYDDSAEPAGYKEFFYYPSYRWFRGYTLLYSDGSSEYIESDDLSVGTDQSVSKPWGPGDHTVTAEYYDEASDRYFTTDFTVTISDESVVDYVEAADIVLYEYTCGNSRTDDEGNKYYYYEYFPASGWTIHFKNGETAETYGTGYFYYNDDYTEPIFFSDQSANHWGVGDHTMTTYILGYEVETTVRILESPIERIEAEDVTAIEGVDSYTDYYWDYDPDTGTEHEIEYDYYDSYSIRPKLTLYLKDGSTLEYDPHDGDLSINDIRLDVNVRTNQGYQNQWKAGNSYPASVEVLNVTAEYRVSVIDTPIKSMDVTFDSVYPYQGGNWQTADNGEQWFCYDNYYPSGTVTMVDGTEYTLDQDNYFYYNGNSYYLSFSTDQSYEHQWEPGTHEVEIEVLGYKTAVPFIIEPSPVKSAELTVEDAYEGLDSYHHRWGDEWDEYNDYYYHVSGTVTFNDGTVVELNDEHYIEYGDDRIGISRIDDQSETNAWGVGTHQAKLLFLGYAAPVQVRVLPNPVKRISATDVTLYEGLDATVRTNWDWDNDTYTYYNVYSYTPEVTIEFTDGTTDQATGDGSGYYSYQFNGNYYSGRVEDDQSSNNQWGVGTHSVSLTLMGKTCSFNVTLKENPVKGISVEKVLPVDVSNYYSADKLRFKLKVDYKDGTSETKALFNPNSWNSQYDNDERIRVELIDGDNWHIGKGNQFKVMYAGYETTAYAEVVAGDAWGSYIETADGIIVTKCYGNDFNIPDEIDGKPVVGVYGNAFPQDIVWLSFGDNIRFISGQLSYPKLNRLYFGKSFEQIDTDTVSKLPALSSIAVSGENASYTSDGSIIYNKDKTEIAAAAPAYSSIIEIPATVQNLDVLNADIYSNLRYYVNDKSKYFTTVDGVTYTKDMKEVVACDREKAGDYTMPSTVEKIRDYAFSYCEELTSVKVSDKVTDIAYRAFGGCYSLKKVELPKNLKSISAQAFSGNSGLTDINIPDTVESIGDVAFSNAKIKTLNLSSIKSLGSSAFYNTGLETVTIDGTLTGLENSVFSYCRNLKSVTLGKNIGSIGAGCFSDCAALTDLTLRGSSVAVGDQAFTGCPLTNFKGWSKLGGAIGYSAFRYNKLQQVSLPSTVTSIAYCAFAGSKDLASITLPDTLLKVDSDAFDGTKWYDNQASGAVYLNKVLYEYKGAMPANTALKLKADTQSIADHALIAQKNLTSITLPEGLKRIGDTEFYGTGITTLDIPASVEEIGTRAFTGCAGLKSVSVAADNPYFTDVDDVLYTKDMTELIYCPARSASSFKLPKTVTKIDSFAFADSKVSKLTILRDDVEIEPFAFGFGITYSFQGKPGDTYKAVYQPMTIICHEGSPAEAYAEEQLLDIISSEQSDFLMGDADGSGTTDLVDVTRIQASLAKVRNAKIVDLIASDIDGNQMIEIIDAAYIQRWVAKMDIPYAVNIAKV